MVRVLYYNHKNGISTKDITKLITNLRKDSNINLDFFEPVRTFEIDKGKLEKMLQGEDVLLIHPGLQGQKTVIEEYPKRFPNLRIAIVSYDIKEYMDKDKRIRLFDYRDIKKIMNFVRSK